MQGGQNGKRAGKTKALAKKRGIEGSAAGDVNGK
jgi:hypothetical protein